MTDDRITDLPQTRDATAALRSTIDIKVITQYLAAQSSPDSAQYAFAYTVHITNNGEQDVQLVARRWLIVDDNDEVQEVAGEGVIGQKPAYFSRAVVPLHQRRDVADAFWHHARRLRNGNQGRRAILSRYSSVPALSARFRSLTTVGLVSNSTDAHFTEQPHAVVKVPAASTASIKL